MLLAFFVGYPGAWRMQAILGDSEKNEATKVRFPMQGNSGIRGFFCDGPMERHVCKTGAKVTFWDSYARWYQQWLEHNAYHRKILGLVTSLARPGWKVLDIGAGSGILSVPLSKEGCDVTALEPSIGMRTLLHQNMDKLGASHITVDRRPWEDVPPNAYGRLDLIIACNSLHLTPMGLRGALRRAFDHKPRWVCVVAELTSADINIPVIKGRYVMRYARLERITSSFAYHDCDEAFEHWAVLKGRCPDAWERNKIKRKIVKRGNHLWMDDSVFVSIFCWEAFR